MFKTVLCAIAVLLAQPAGAQGYPSQPIRMIAPFPPGGSVDIMARLISEPLARELGGKIVIDNRTGASGNIGMEAAARAKPDGYTIVLNTIPLATNQALFDKLILGSGQGLRADRHGGHRAARARRSGQGEGDHRRRADKNGARQSGQAELRLCRRRHHLPSLRRDVQGLDQHLHPARPLSRRRPGAARHARRPGGHELPDVVGRAAAREGRHAARACRHRYDALRAAARSADHAASGREGLPVHPVARAARARRHAARRRRAA